MTAHKQNFERVKKELAANGAKMDKMSQDRIASTGSYALLIGVGCVIFAFTGSFSLSLGFCCIVVGLAMIAQVSAVKEAEKEKADKEEK